MSAHQTVIINLNTQRVPPELVKKLRIPVLLLHLSDQDASGEPIQFSIKWNPILERFESFEVNMGWKEELQTLP